MPMSKMFLVLLSILLALAPAPVLAAHPDGFKLSPLLHDYSYVFVMAQQPRDGKILAGGLITTDNKTWRYRNLVRLNPDGSLDPDFSTEVEDTTGIPAEVRCILILP